jgi:protein-disulfide isomerase
MQKHVSWILALVVGLVLGVVADRMAGGTGTPSARRPEPAAKPGETPRPPPRPQEDPKAVYRVPVDDSPVRGPDDALVTIVESSEFECPFCKRVAPTLKEIEQTYGGKVRFVFKHNPLPFHAKAMPAAVAAEEARSQGGSAKFWAMHDKLFEAAPALERANLEQAAQQLGLDLAAFRRALDDNRHEARIKRDQQLMNGLDARGTPTFFINGRKVVGAVPFQMFKAVIDDELAKAEAMVKAGTPPREVYARIMEKAAAAPVMLPAEAAAAQPAAPSPAPSAPPAVASKVAFRADDPSRGPKAAKVTIVLFSDFQCPFCSRVNPTLQQLEKAYPGDVKVVWKHQPLSFHPQAMPAAEAAEAAREQDKFWEMHDLLFADQAKLSAAQYEAYAKQLKLDQAKFKASVESHRNKPRIEEDAKQANQVGATGTPTLFVNCRQVVGAQPFERFKAIVDEEIKKADELGKKGVKVDAAFYARICDENVKAAAAAAPAPAARQPEAVVAVPLRPDDPSRGNAKAPVTLVVFSDFQCPFCSRAVPTLQQIEQSYGKDVRIVWKHQPLAFHPQAFPAAEAAEAAREQGKFWQMHDLLFANQSQLSQAQYEALAKQLGLDQAKFKAALESRRNKGRIDEDMKLAQQLGVTGTPTFFVNGRRIVGAQPYDAFKQAIDAELKKNGR